MVEADLQIRPSVEQWNSQAEKLAALQDVSQMHESRVLALEETARTGGSGSRGECSSVVCPVQVPSWLELRFGLCMGGK